MAPEFLAEVYQGGKTGEKWARDFLHERQAGDRNSARESQSLAHNAATSYVENLWDAPSQPQQTQTGLWGSLDNVWPSTVFNSGFNDGRNLGRDTDSGSLGYDSLSLSSIWSSAGAQVQHQETETAGGDNTWSSLFTENKKDL